MPPVTLPNLYCLPSDVYDYLGTEGAQLRQDDHDLATGQVMTVQSAAAQGATSLSIDPLQYPLLPGTTLEFDGGGMSAVVEAVLTTLAVAGATSLSVAALPQQINQYAQARDSGVNVALAARLVKACNYATAQVKLYCCGRYDDSQLALSWSVNRWATNLGAKWMCRRRGGVTPKGVEEDAKEALEEMKYVQRGMLNIEDIGTRTAGWPFISNVSIQVGYDYAKLRVEQALSEPTPTQYGQYIDWNAALWIEYW